MVSTMPVVREVGRPRSFEDDAIFAATARVIARVGHDGLTLAAIAEEVGCSAPALVQRFGSKRALVRAYIEWSIDNIQQRWDKVSAPELSPSLNRRKPRSKCSRASSRVFSSVAGCAAARALTRANANSEHRQSTHQRALERVVFRQTVLGCSSLWGWFR